MSSESNEGTATRTEIQERHDGAAEEVLPGHTNCYIGGEFVAASDGETFDTIEDNVEDLARLESLDNGKPLSAAKIDVHDTVDTHVATARGVYKTGGDDRDTPWLDGTNGSMSDHAAE